MANGIISLVKKLPVYAVDIKKNLEEIFLKDKNDYLTEEELYSVALTVGYALRHENVLNNIRADAKLVLEDSNANACKVAAVMMSMNNIFYNFKDMSEDHEIDGIDSGLSMTSLHDIGVDMKTFEMCCLAASILNKCKYCIKVHEKKLTNKGTAKGTFVEIAKVVSIISAAAVAMDIERLRSYDFVVREASVDD
jgi:alkyl hydroperoxide reductase subunit D